MTKPILCLDFDGVIHSYTSGWKGADVVVDPPVPGAIYFILEAVEHFEVHIFSSRSNQEGGIRAMKKWLAQAVSEEKIINPDEAWNMLNYAIKWPTEKPPAMVTLDDRALTFTGEWPAIADLQTFKPWNKK